MNAAVVPITDKLSDPVPPIPVKLSATKNSDLSHKVTEKQTQPSISVAIALAFLTLILGVVGGLLASVATNAQWKGEMENRIRNLELQRSEDKQDLNAKYDYIRTQNEVNGKALARIEASMGLRGRR
jgi:hypothetical protein